MNEYTNEQIVEITIQNLSGIQMPNGPMTVAEFTEKIGIPLVQNINNLKILLNQMREQTAKQEKEEPEKKKAKGKAEAE